MQNNVWAIMSAFILMGGIVHADAIYQENFDGTLPTLVGNNQAELGGSAANTARRDINLGEWAYDPSTGNGVISGGAMNFVAGHPAYIGVGTFQDASSMVSGTTYRLTFDLVASQSGNASQDGNAFVDVWSASGFNIADGNNNESRVMMDTRETAAGVKLTTFVDASASDLGGLIIADAGTYTSQTYDFTWDGGDAVALMFSGNVGMDGAVDNISINVVPEPATLGLITVFSGAMLFIRRRFMI